MKDRKKILIIEDDAGLRFVLEKFLGHFFKVTVKSDGKEALKWMVGNTPDLIITDLDMPHINGIQFIKNMKASLVFKDLKIMVITGHDDRELKTLCKEYGVLEYYVKPFNPAQVVLRIYEEFNLPKNGNKKLKKLYELI